MQPDLTTDARLFEVLAELRAREPIFHRPELGTSRADFERMTAEDFWEIGASGRRYSREYVLEVLEERHRSALEDRWETEDFRCQELATGLYLLTYTLRQGARVTRRATIWRRVAQEWQIVFHQGTLVEDPAS
jgi:hypothetical protein